MRSTAHAKVEKAVFDAFLAAHPSFAAQVKDVDQPDDEFPDIVVKTLREEIDFEIGEWLDGPQIAAAKRREAFDAAIFDAIGPQGENPSGHFQAVMLCPIEGVTTFERADRDGFRTELWTLVGKPTTGGRPSGSGVPRRAGAAVNSPPTRSSGSISDR